MAVIWRGVRLDPRSRDMMEEVARLTKPYVQPTQGSYSGSVSQSAGTHDGGGAIDIGVSAYSSAQKTELIRVMRIVGWAAWLRLSSEGDWVEHIHAIAVDQSDLAPSAARQVEALRNGRNGLANNGPDRHANLNLPVVTWEEYQSQQLPDTGEQMSWSFKGLDYVNSSSTTKDNQVARGHQYSHSLRHSKFSRPQNTREAKQTLQWFTRWSYAHGRRTVERLGSHAWLRDNIGRAVLLSKNSVNGKTVSLMLRQILEFTTQRLPSPITGNQLSTISHAKGAYTQSAQVNEKIDIVIDMLSEVLSSNQRPEFEAKISAISKYIEDDIVVDETDHDDSIPDSEEVVDPPEQETDPEEVDSEEETIQEEGTDSSR